MKKLIAIIFCLVLTFSLFACSNAQGNNSSNEGNSSSIEGGNTSSEETPTSSEAPSSSSGEGNNYTEKELETLTKATNVIDWQLDNGGWGKNYDTTTEFTGFPSDYCWSVGGKFVGTIDNDATYTEMRLLAEAYDISGEKKYKDSFDKGMQFLKNLQYPSGGFAQIYPHNGKYNDYVTFNDDAMISVLYLLQDIADNKKPFQNIVTEAERQNCTQMIDKAVDYIIKAQIIVQGEKSAWCAQHDPTDYSPKKGRDYELPSVSGQESVPVIQFLLTQTDNEEALAAAEAARVWLMAHRIENMTYSKRNPPKFFTESEGDYCWYRFYSLEEGRGFYCTRAGVVYYDIDEFYAADSERATSYDWAGTWLSKARLDY